MPLKSTELIDISRARRRLPGLVRAAAEKGRSFGLLRRGNLDAVLVGTRELQGLLETVEILTDPKLRSRVRRGMREASEGALVTWSEAKSRWRRRQQRSASRRRA